MLVAMNSAIAGHARQHARRPFDFAQGRLSIARSADHTFTLDALGVKIG